MSCGSTPLKIGPIEIHVMSESIVVPAPGYPEQCREDGGDVAGKSSVNCVPADGEFVGELGREWRM